MALATMAEVLEDRAAREAILPVGPRIAGETEETRSGEGTVRASAGPMRSGSPICADNDRDRAAKDFDESRVIYRELAADRAADVVSQIEWLEAELASVFWSGYDTGAEHLMRTNQIRIALSGIWPTDPNGIYRTVCYLTHEEPILLQSATGELPAAASAAASPSSR